MSDTTVFEIELAMAKAFFASAWADLQDEKDADDPTKVNLSGKEIMNLIPAEIDAGALHAARTLRFDMERVNCVPITVLYADAVIAGSENRGDREPTLQNFGHYAAMQAMGHGVGLDDVFGEGVSKVVKVPYVEFGSHGLQKDY